MSARTPSRSPALPADRGPWHGAGPLLDADLAAQVRDALRDADAPVPEPLDHTGAARALAGLWDSAEPKDGARVRALERRLERLSAERTREAYDTLTRVLGRLESAPCTVAELVATVPQLICELGFSRGLISRVEGEVWTPELMYVVGDPDSSEELTQVGQAAPLRMRPGLFELEAVQTRTAIIASEVQQQPWRSHPGLAQASETRSYVAAPVVSEGEVVGLLHAERYGQRRDVDELDRQVLAAFAEGVRLALSRAAVAEELESLQRATAAATRSAGQALAHVHRLPGLRVNRGPQDAPDGLVVRTGPPGLPRDLSPRELEVLELMAAGKANHAIAYALGIAEGTVKQHVKHVLRKLMVGSRAEAVARWFQAGGASGATR